MDAASSPGRPHQFWNAATSVLFVVLLWLPAADYFFKLDRCAPLEENRAAAPRPHFERLRESQKFITAVENYFNDHFGFRNRLVRWNRDWKRWCFNGPVSREVLVGREHWLYWAGDRMMEHYAGHEVFTDQQLDDWRQLLEMRRDWLQARGIKYLFVVAPDKHSVYPEYLPAWLEPSHRPSKREQFMEYMKTHSKVPVLDLAPSLIEAKATRIDYLQTDTHWNAFGGFVAYRAVVEALSRQLPDLKPLPLDAYRWQPVPSHGLDLARQMGITEVCTDAHVVTPIATQPVVKPEMVHDPDRFPRPGIGGNLPVLTLNKQATGKAMIFRDSFATSWYDFLAQHFNETIYVWQFYWDRPLIEREKPDVVVDEMLERIFNVTPADGLVQLDRASETNAPATTAALPR